MSDSVKHYAWSWIDENSRRLIEISDEIWGYAELGFVEFKSSKLLADEIESHGFEVEREVAGIPTAFVATWGSGRPIIGVMGEFDATFKSMFEFFGFSESQVDKGLRVARKEDLSRKSDRQLRANTHISSRQTTKWQRYFEPSHKEAFAKRFKGALVKLGYEEGESW